MIKKITLIILLLICMATIFMFSSQNGNISGNLSSGITLTLARIFVKGFENFDIEKQIEIVDSMHFYIRKAAHFSIYALLGFIAWLNLHQYTENTRKKFLISLPFCLLYAASDEFHQLFTDGRSGSPKDVAIDFSGAIIGTVIAFFLIRIISKFQKKQKIFLKNY